MTMTDQDLRFDTPLYSVAEAARYLDVPSTTFTSWAKGYVRRSPDRRPVTGAPVLCVVEGTDGPSVPPRLQRRQVVADPTRSFGQPMFVHGGARVRRCDRPVPGR